MLRIVYAGSPEISSVPLKGLLEDGSHRIVAVLTNPPSSKGRHGALVPTPVETVAREFCAQNQLDEEPLILTPEHLDASVREKIAALKPDILVCFAYGKIFGPKFMELFPMGGINLHPSLLPKYRGCAPVPASILNMDKTTGFTIQRVAQEMDSGNILLQTCFNIEESDNSQTILDRAANEGSKLFLEVLNKLEKCKKEGTEFPDEHEQDSSKATYCGFLEKEDGKIDWNESAEKINAKIRAFYPWPGAFTSLDGTMLKIHRATVVTDSCAKEVLGLPENQQDFVSGKVLGKDKRFGIFVQTGNGILALQNLQLQGKKAMEWADFLNGNQSFIGKICGK